MRQHGKRSLDNFRRFRRHNIRNHVSQMHKLRLYPQRGRLTMISEQTPQTTQAHPILTLNPEPDRPKPAQTRKPGKQIVLECPRCCWIIRLEKLDNRHPRCALSKPERTTTKGDVIEEPRVCRNPRCKKQFTLYWYKQTNRKSA